MVDTVFLHIGMHKTGTSSIQKSLKGYDDGVTFYADLEENNHSIPLYTAFAEKFLKYHIFTNRGFSKQEIEEKRIKYRRLFAKQLNRRDRKNIIICGEDISILDDAGKSSLIQFIKAEGCNIELIFYVRSPTSFAASSFQQQVRGGETKLPRLIKPHYKKMLHEFIRLLPKNNINIRVFERGKLKDGCVVKDFCQVVGIDDRTVNIKRENESLSLSALKLIYQFNKSGVLSAGDRLLYEARLQLINLIKETYAQDDKIKTSIFSGVADHSEDDYLESEFNVSFKRENESENPDADLSQVMEDLSDVNLKLLDDLLHSHGVHSEFDTVQEKLYRLYYCMLINQSIKLSEYTGFLYNNDADVLRDIALKYEGNTALTNYDAYHLMELAHRARSEGPFIKKKLDEYSLFIQKNKR